MTFTKIRKFLNIYDHIHYNGIYAFRLVYLEAIHAADFV